MNNDFFKMPDRIFGVSSSLIKLFLLPLGVILVFLFSLRLVIIPKIDSIKSLQTSIAKVKSEIKTTDAKRSYLTSVDQNELLQNESYLSSAVLQAKNSYLLVGVVRNIADKFGYQVKSFSINPVKLKDEDESLKVSSQDVATKLPIDVVLSGPKANMVDLLISIENSLPIMFIDKIDVASKVETSEVSLTVSSYYVPDNSSSISGNLTLNDLIPTEEESNLLLQISQFNQDENLTKTLQEQTSDEKTYVQYNRENPFTL